MNANDLEKLQRRLSVPTLSRLKTEEQSFRNAYSGGDTLQYRFRHQDISLRRHTFAVPALTKGYESQKQAVDGKTSQPDRGPLWGPEVPPDGFTGAPSSLMSFSLGETLHTWRRLSKVRQKNFRRHFREIDAEEKVLGYYSCALVKDILLQGHLYVTKNFFAFYSNVFGYVTKLLIPTAGVLKISKEKTAKIIPNAIGVFTENEKHIFGSLLSRDSAYAFMVKIWKSANDSPIASDLTVPKIVECGPSDDEESSSFSGDLEPRSFTEKKVESLFSFVASEKKRKGKVASWKSHCFGQKESAIAEMVLWIVLVTLLGVLFALAGHLLLRIKLIQNQLAANNLSVLVARETDQGATNWRSLHLFSSPHKLHEYLKANLDKIAEIRSGLQYFITSIWPNFRDAE